MLLGVGALALVGYYIWKSQQPKKDGEKKNAMGNSFDECYRICRKTKTSTQCYAKCLG